MAKWNLPEGKIYTQAELDAAVAAQREKDAKVAKAHKKLAVIAAQEAQRERDAKLAEAHVDNEDSYGPDFDAGWEAAAFAIAAAIRAQGENPDG